MRRLASNLPFFAFPFWVHGVEYRAEVNPTAMLVTLRRDGEVQIPFNLDTVKKVAALVPPETFPLFLGEDTDPNDVVEGLSGVLTQHLICPACGCCVDEGRGFDDNGRSSSSVFYSLLCLGCTHSWDPNDG